MAKAPSKAVAKIEESKDLAPMSDAPDYLTGNERTGAEALGKGDFKVPRIKLLQPLSPEVRTFQGKAFAGHFWHTGANKSLGIEFNFVPIIVNKRVVVWRPRDDNNGGILAFSKDGKNWDSGGNSEFTVKLKDVAKPVTWKTGKDVQSSGLLEFGSSNPDVANSSPAATIAYEYLCYLPNDPQLSPVVLGVSKTGTPNARQLNTYFLSINKPLTCMVIKCFTEEVSKNRNVWTVPKFDPAGWAPREWYHVAQEMQKNYADYETEMVQDEQQENIAPIDDEVAY